MIWLKSLASAFLMYSKIPVPRVEWKEENRRYALCFFPAVGAVIGCVFLAWRYICAVFDIGDFMNAAVSALIPVFVTGGIHLDGFCDVVDAKSSYGSREKKLEIMSDPHIGSFAVIAVGAYMISQIALLYEISLRSTVIVAALGFVLSRALSGLAAVTFKSAKSDGTLQAFVRPAHKKITVILLSAVIASDCAAMIVASPVIGGFSAVGAAVCFGLYRICSYKDFGGITGDLAGWFLQICEISMLAFAVFGEKFSEALGL